MVQDDDRTKRLLLILGLIALALGLSIISLGIPLGPIFSFLSALAATAGVGLVLVWQRQDLRSYRQAEAAVARQQQEFQEVIQQLEQSRAMLQLIVEAMPVRIFWKDRDLRYMGCNSLFAHDAGLLHPQELLGQDDFAMAWRDQADLYRADDLNVIASGQPRLKFVEPQTTAAGNTIWLSTSKAPLQLPGGEIFGVLGVYEDITERRQAEALIAAQRDLARIIATTSSMQAAWPRCLELVLQVAGMDCGGIYLFDPAFQALEMVHHQGLSAEYVHAVSRYSTDTPNVQLILSGRSAYFAADEVQQMEIPRLEGLSCIAVIPIQYQGRVLGCVNAASCTLAEVSAFARHALEIVSTEIGNIVIYLRTVAALREREEQYRGLIDSQESAISTLDADGRFHYINQIGAAPLAGSPGAVVGRSLRDFFPPQVADWQLEQVRKVIASGQGMVAEVQHRVTGELRCYRTSIQPIRDADGAIVLAMVNSLDVTDREQAEAQLRESQLRLELALRGANLGMWDWYVQSGRTVFNERWASIVGYTLAELEPVSIQTWIDLCHPEDLPRSNALLRQHLSGESELYECEIRLRHRLGHWVWVIDRGQVVERDGEGRPVRMTGTHLDITARKQVEQDLLELNRTLEERVRQRTAEVQDLYDNAPIGYHSLDAEGRVLMVNQTQLSWLGYTREELIGGPAAVFLTPPSQAAFQDHFPAFKERGWVRGLEFDLLHKDGTVIPVLLSATAIYDERGEYVMSRTTVLDNTERKAAELALRESELQNRLLFEESPDAIVLFDEAGIVIEMNRAFQLLTGFSAEQVVGRTLVEVGLLSYEHVLQLSRAVVRHLEEHSSFAAVEFKLGRAGGGLSTVGARIFGLQIRGRQHYLATMRDITTEKMAEATLRRANAELARAARAKDEFLANMSHELRTPLNAILAYSESLLETIFGPLTERQQSSIHYIETSGRHLLALINDILDLSKVEAGRLNLELEPVSIADVCQSSMLFVREMALKKSLRLAFNLNDQIAKMEADPKRLKQMLVNLLSNAVKFTPAEGQVSLTVLADAEAQVVRFAVQDTGVGIAPEDLARLFQPFVQLDSSLSRQHEGTGLGLALVRRLAELHGGSVKVESEVGAGSCFTIALPYRTPAPVEGPIPAVTPAGVMVGVSPIHTAMIVEDSESAAEHISRYLGELNLQVIVHLQGEGACEQAIRLRPDVILLDLLMPSPTGWEVLAQLKADPRTSAIPVLIISVVDDRLAGLAAGAAEVLVKPISREGLLRALRSVAAALGPPPPTPAPAPAPPPVVARVLLAEDNEINILAVGEYLEARGYEVAIARNGRQALDLAEAAPPDLILMDIQMPEIDGLEAIRRLRARPASAAMPIIALTALAMPGDRERCLEAGASVYLTKPVRLKELVKTIERLLHR